MDRSAAYMARYIAKNLVAAGLAERAEVQIAYAIGVARPLSVSVETFGTGKVSPRVIDELVARHFDLRPAAIIKYFDLRRPIYRQTATYGHFGRDDLDLPWEKTDKAEILSSFIEEEYGKVVDLPLDPNVSRNMRGYYAFNWRRYEYSMHPMTVGAIVETGFLTNPNDRQIIVSSSQLAAEG